jgi:putative pyruvate formate lyase activating enzyme
VNREAGERGFCGETAELRIAAASIHRGEEPPITGRGGSGTIFVSGCNLGCAFCQNYQISQGNEVFLRNRISGTFGSLENEVSFGNRISGDSGSLENEGPLKAAAGLGRPVGPEEFTRICLALQERGAENINIVTGSHAVPALAAGLEAARSAGLRIPALWNSSAYESPEALELLRGRINGWLPDLKTLDSGLAARFFRAPGYPDAARTAILKMLDMSAAGGGPDSPEALFIIRHLVLPGYLESTRQVLRWFAEHVAGRARLSLMTHYPPVASGLRPDIPDRYLNAGEYETVLRWLEEFGIEEGFYQELLTGSDWLPDFTRQNPFSSDLSVPVWHWKEGFVSLH